MQPVVIMQYSDGSGFITPTTNEDLDNMYSDFNNEDTVTFYSPFPTVPMEERVAGIAHDLASDEGENREYDRALLEMALALLGLCFDEEDHDMMLKRTGLIKLHRRVYSTD